MALPTNVQAGDVAFDNGVWYQVVPDPDSGTGDLAWAPFGPESQAYFTQHIAGVSGSGENQRFVGRGDFSSSFSREELVSALSEGRALGSTGLADARATAQGNVGTQGALVERGYKEFKNDPNAEWPPMWGNTGMVDSAEVEQYLGYAKQRNLFSDQQLQEAGIETIGGRTYIRQPDGELELVPEAKAKVAAPAAPSIETHGGIQFINQDGKLVPIDNMMKKMKENFVVTGDFEGASAVHQWETRPSNQEYFDRMLQYVNAPADQLLISAIARGQGLVAPPPEETIQRIGPQPEYLTEAFNMLREQMQMGQPGEGETFESIMQKNAADLAQRKGEEELRQSKQDSEDRHNAAVIANEFNSTTNEMDINDRITAQYNLALDEGGETGDFSFADALAKDWGGFEEDDVFERATGQVATGDVEPASMSAFDRQIAAGGLGSDLADASGWRTTMNTKDVQDFWDKLDDKQKAFVNGWEGGIWTFASSAQNLQELERNLNFHFENAPETVGKIIPQVDGSSTLVTPEGEARIAELNVPGEADALAALRAKPTPPSPTDTAIHVETGRESIDAGPAITYDDSPAALTPETFETFGPDPGGFQRDVAPTLDPVVEPEPQQISPQMPTTGAGVSAALPMPGPMGAAPAPVATPTISRPTQLDLAPIPAPVVDTPAPRVWETGGEDDFMAGGGIYDDNTAIVGESGPELAIFPRGTEIVPLDRRMKRDQAMRLRNRGVRGMQEGGIVFDDPRDNPLPLGIRQLQAGRSLGAPRGQLLRTAGIALPSAQARRRMLPSEREAFQGLGRMAGIPVGEFQQELGITTPSGAPRIGSARMLPLSLRR